MTSAELRKRNSIRRQQLIENFVQNAKTPQRPAALFAEALFALVEIGGELCAQVAELREAITERRQS